jgi:lipid II:glycine glycyltransferase (peptidoglycan interpeptide bridge formation enzyme)
MREIAPADRERWDAFVAGAPNGHLLQGWAWGEFKRLHGWRPVRLALVQDGQWRAVVQVLFRSIAGLSLAYVPRGPVASFEQSEAYAQLLAGLHRYARRRLCLVLKVEPNEPASPELGEWLRRQGFVKSPHTAQPRATLMLDLADGAEAVLAALPKTTRYQIRLAARRGVQARAARDDGDVQTFAALMGTTGERAGFAVRSPRYYQDVLRLFGQRGQAALFLAEREGQVIAGVMVFAFGSEGIYMYAASTNEHKEASPNDLLQWRAIQWCIDKGCTRYDLWGIPPEAELGTPGEGAGAPDTADGLWGVYRFKRRFAKRAVHYVGAYDYPYVPPLYRLWARLRKNKGL